MYTILGVSSIDQIRGLLMKKKVLIVLLLIATAANLGMSRRALLYKIKRYGLGD